MGSAAKPGQTPGQTPGETSGQDDVKRRFKEALDRKNGRHAEAAAAGEGNDQAKVHGGAHGPAHLQRQFRRKSG